MIASIPGFQELLNGMGWVLARIYDVIPNWGLSIIALTLLIRVVLVPLGVKQIRSMWNMQAIQGDVKRIQQKYKGNKQKQQEEIMNLYREHGVNPFSGCWPMLLQFPILIAMYAVVRFPQYPVHLPVDSDLYHVISVQVPEPATQADLTAQFLKDQNATQNQDGAWVVPAAQHPSGTEFLGMNLLCSARDAGNASAQVPSRYRTVPDGKSVIYQLNCGSSVPDRIPYYVFALLMFGTTFYQQRQMQSASPPGASSQQQQALMKFMPLMFGVFGFFFPVGLVLYWTVSNGWQIGQQYVILRNRPSAEDLATKAKADGRGQRKGFMASMMERADQERKRRDTGNGRPAPKKPGSASGKPGTPPQRKPGSGGSGAGSRKKRPKR
jgi:YidC/Oxa1 family membrane protein insertase